MKHKTILFISMLMAYVTGHAHPGHGDSGGFTITHYLVEPEHVFIGLSILALLVSAAGTMLKRKKKIRYHKQADL